MAAWPPLAWLETIIKLLALALGIDALLGALAAGSFALPAGPALLQFLILLLLSLGLLAAIADRLAGREIIAMIFVLINNLGHWGMTLALAAGVTVSLAAFAGLMLLGDLVKIWFIRRHQFTVRGYSAALLYGLTSTYILGYAALLLLEWLK